MPLCALMWFGCFSLGIISLNLMRLEDCAKASAELQLEVLQARADLRRRGLKDVVEAE